MGDYSHSHLSSLRAAGFGGRSGDETTDINRNVTEGKSNMLNANTFTECNIYMNCFTKSSDNQSSENSSANSVSPWASVLFQEPGAALQEVTGYKYRSAISGKAIDITAAYKTLLSKTEKSALKASPYFENVLGAISNQKTQFAVTSDSLGKFLSRASSGEAASELHLYDKILQELDYALESLSAVPDYFAKLFTDFERRRDPDLDRMQKQRALRPDIEADRILQNVQDTLNKIVDLFEQLKSRRPQRRDTRPEVPDQQLQRLSLEGLAASRLYQCLCRACPVEDHEKHTAFLGLESGSGAVDNQTEHHMAIESRMGNTLIWLRVVSVMSRASNQREPAGAAGPPLLTEPETRGGKGQLSEDYALHPPSKVQKRETDHTATSRRYANLISDRPTDHHYRRIQDHSAMQIQVCPEYLAQHNDDLLVMQIGDVSSICHRIYFLPKDKQPLKPCESISLAKMLQARRVPEKILKRSRMASRETQGMLWIVRVARLVSEAILRFDWRDSRCRWKSDNVIFYTPSQDCVAEHGPFLKVNLESTRGHHSGGTTTTSTTANDNSSAIDNDRTPVMITNGDGHEKALLNLGFILLQLGLFEPIEASLEIMGEEDCREYILHHTTPGKLAEFIITGDEYINVVRRCANFFSPIIPTLSSDSTTLSHGGQTVASKEKYSVSEEIFRKEYYRSIISPLRKLENELTEMDRL